MQFCKVGTHEDFSFLKTEFSFSDGDREMESAHMAALGHYGPFIEGRLLSVHLQWLRWRGSPGSQEGAW